jgi:hypothetical protein
MNERNDERRDDARNDGSTAEERGAAPGGRTERTVVEEFRVRSEDVIAKIKELVREGNVRRITIKNEEGKTLIEVPLSVGVIGTLLLPAWAAVGAIAALVANLTLAVERREGPGETPPAVRPAGEDEMKGGDAHG